MVVWEETLQSTTKILSVIILVILVILNYIAADYIDENDRIYIFEIEGEKNLFLYQRTESLPRSQIEITRSVQPDEISKYTTLGKR